jgi:nitroreductase
MPNQPESTAPAATPLAVLSSAILGRRNVKAFLPQPVPRPLLAELIDLAVWAPNHRLTEPWRFYVLDGASRQRLGELARQQTVMGLPATADPSAAQLAGDQAAAAWASVPALLYLTFQGDPKPEIDRENYAAACCAAQNFMLAATGAGLATSWSSGGLACSPEMLALVGAGPAEQMVGLFRVGYPDPEQAGSTGRRKPASTYTVWLDDAGE